MILLKFISILLLILASCLQGVSDAVMYSKRGADAFPWNEHIFLVLQRGSWMLFVGVGLFLKPIDLLFITPAFVLFFSFFHNWAFEYTKSKIFNIPRSLVHSMMYLSPTDTAKNSYDFASRAYMLVFSIIILVVWYLISPHI